MQLALSVRNVIQIHSDLMSFLHDVEVISFLPDTSISKFFVGMLDNERYAAYSVIQQLQLQQKQQLLMLHCYYYYVYVD